MDPRETKIDDFVKHSVSVHALAEYLYCPARILARKIAGEVTTPFTLEGAKMHGEEASRLLKGMEVREAKVEIVHDLMLLSLRNLRRALKERRVLANPKEGMLFATILPCGVFGKPDAADCTDGMQPTIVEMKTKRELPILGSPWENDELQVAAYVMGLEELGFRPERGIIKYVLRSDPTKRKESTVILTDTLRNKVLSTADGVRRLLDGKDEPSPSTSMNKCRACHEKLRTVCHYKFC